jgi:hypothetical protein
MPGEGHARRSASYPGQKHATSLGSDRVLTWKTADISFANSPISAAVKKKKDLAGKYRREVLHCTVSHTQERERAHAVAKYLRLTF